MITTNNSKCPNCGGELKHYDSVQRSIRQRNREKVTITLRRLRCVDCETIHRELPDNVVPFKQYDSNIIEGVVSGLITEENLEYEDYPCEMTMKRWKEFYEFTHSLRFYKK